MFIVFHLGEKGEITGEVRTTRAKLLHMSSTLSSSDSNEGKKKFFLNLRHISTKHTKPLNTNEDIPTIYLYQRVLECI